MNIKCFYLVGILTIFLTETDGCNETFSKCFCGEMNYGGYHRNVLNCTNTGFKDPSVLQKLPDKIEVSIVKITFKVWKNVGSHFCFSSTEK